MVITAQDELTLICGGGYIKITGGNVEIGGSGKLLIKNSGIKKAGAGSMQGVMRSFEPSTFDEKFIIRNALTKEPLPGERTKLPCQMVQLFPVLQMLLAQHHSIHLMLSII